MTIAMSPWTAVAVYPYHTIATEIERVLPDFVMADDRGRLYDYWSALETVCLALGYNSGSAVGNLIDGMLVDAVEDKYGVALPDSRLCGKGAA